MNSVKSGYDAVMRRKVVTALALGLIVTLGMGWEMFVIAAATSMHEFAGTAFLGGILIVSLTAYVILWIIDGIGRFIATLRRPA